MLTIDLSNQTVLIAGISDDKGLGWGIAKAFKRAGAKVIAATWPPALQAFLMTLERDRFDTELKNLSTSNSSAETNSSSTKNSKLTFEKVYPLDVAFDTLNEASEEIKTNRRYQNIGDYSIQGLKDAIEKDFGKNSLTAVVHAIAHAPEIQNPLLKTTRSGYLSALSVSSYSFIKIIQLLSPIMKAPGSFLSLSYLGGSKAIPGYGGGMSTAKAALESDLNLLSYEVGRQYGHRVNIISPGPVPSRAARAIQNFDQLIEHYRTQSPLQQTLSNEDIGPLAAFLSSNLANAITGNVVYIDHGYHVMGATMKV